MAGTSSADRLSSGEYKYPFWQLVFGLVKKVVKIILVALLLGIIVYGAVALTAARYVYIYDNGYVLTMNPKTDILSSGTKVVFDMNATEESTPMVESITGRFELATLPPTSISVGEIVAGPTGQMTFDDQLNVSVDGKPTGLRMKEKPAWSDQYLKDQYVIKCIVGDCNTGESYMLTTKSINGIVNSKVQVPFIDDGNANKDVLNTK